jgi:transcriptional regulator GlxA family with amidase domain
MTTDVGFLVFPGFQLLDLSGPLAAFEIAKSLDRSEAYRLTVVSTGGGPIESSSGLTVMTDDEVSHRFDTFVVVGGSGAFDGDELARLADTTRRQALTARRLASVCTAAFVLAEAGVLDEVEATTHWQYASELQRKYPSVKVRGDKIFTRQGRTWTSAGLTSGIDLALALIEDDLGSDLAARVARMLVVPTQRAGGQSQYAKVSDVRPESERISVSLSFAIDHLHEPLSVERLAEVAGMSARQFGRVFSFETGETPARAVERLRCERAREKLLEECNAIEAIAADVGFGDPERMRRAFIRTFGVPPQSFKRNARG